MTPFLALITPIGDGPVTPPTQPPLGIWGPNDPRPTVPIAGWNPGTGQFPPTQQPPYPSHPIYGNFPTPPIFYPPGTRPPGQGGAQPPQQPPLVIWGPGDPRPTFPISGWNPGTGQWPTPPGGGEGEAPKFEMKTAWSESTGWVVVFVPTGPTPTPSEGGTED